MPRRTTCLVSLATVRLFPRKAPAIAVGAVQATPLTTFAPLAWRAPPVLTSIAKATACPAVLGSTQVAKDLPSVPAVTEENSSQEETQRFATTVLQVLTRINWAPPRVPSARAIL